MGDDPSEGLVRALEAHLGEGVEITGLRPLTSGASRQSIRFEAAAPRTACFFLRAPA